VAGVAEKSGACTALETKKEREAASLPAENPASMYQDRSLTPGF